MRAKFLGFLNEFHFQLGSHGAGVDQESLNGLLECRCEKWKRIVGSLGLKTPQFSLRYRQRERCELILRMASRVEESLTFGIIEGNMDDHDGIELGLQTK